MVDKLGDVKKFDEHKEIEETDEVEGSRQGHSMTLTHTFEPRLA